MMNRTSLKEKTKQIKTDIYALYLAYKDPRVPWYAKVFAAVIIGYALSPIDLIPDFIPVLGYLDDLIIIPVGISLVIKMIPKEVLEECRGKAISKPISVKSKWVAAFIIVFIWLLIAYIVLRFILRIIL